MKYSVSCARALLAAVVLSDGQVIVWDDAPTSVLPERRTKDTQVPLNIPELNGTMQNLLADVSSLKQDMTAATSKVAAISAKLHPPAAEVPSGLAAPPAPAPSPVAVAFRAERNRGDGLPEQGFEGEDVEHEDSETKTDDWGTEYGPESDDFHRDDADEKGTTEDRVGMHSKRGGARRHGHRHRQVQKEDGLPEQGFEGEDVEHGDGETKVDDWGEEYGPESDDFHRDDADEEGTTEDRVAMHSKRGGARRHGHRDRQVQEEDGLPEQGFEGEDVEHEDGETKTDDWGEEYGPESEGFHGESADEEGTTEDRVAMHSKRGGARRHGHRGATATTTTTTGLPEQGFEGEDVEHEDGETQTDDFGKEYGPESEEGADEEQDSDSDSSLVLRSEHVHSRQHSHSRKRSRGRSQKHLRVRRESHEVPEEVEEAPSFLQIKATPGASEYYAPWFGAPGNAPQLQEKTKETTSGGGFPFTGATVAEEQGYVSESVEHKEAFLQRNLVSKAAPESREYYAPWFGAPGNSVAEPQQPEQGFEGEDVEHKDGETYTEDWQEEHGTTEQTTEAPTTTAAL